MLFALSTGQDCEGERRVRVGRAATRENVLTILLVGVLAATLAIAAVVQYGRSSVSTQEPASVSRSVAFIGDSFTSGTPVGGVGETNYTALLASRHGWSVTNAAVDDTGYLVSLPGRGPFESQMATVVAARPALVVIVGGRADADASPADVTSAAGTLYRDLRIVLPRAEIVVIGPIWTAGEAPDNMLRVSDSVGAAAAAAGFRFTDPIRERWFSAPDSDGLASDRRHLNDRGHQRLADFVDVVLTPR